MKLVALVSFVGLILLSSIPVQAYVTPLSDPIPGGSWHQPFSWTNVGSSSINMMRLDIVPNSGSQLFVAPGMDNFGGQGGWSVSHFDSRGFMVTATNPLPVNSSFSYHVHYADTSSQPIHYYTTTYSNGQWNEGEILTRDSNFVSGLTSIGAGWYAKALDQVDWDPGMSPIPEPGGLMLLGAGIAAVVFLRRNRRA